MSRNSQKPTVTVNEFPGLRTADDDVEVGAFGLTKALNVDITRQKKVKRRKGATQQFAATIDAAAGGDEFLLYTSGSDLVSVDENITTGTVLRSDLTPSNQLAAMKIGDRIFYSNGIETGAVENGFDRELGVRQHPKVDLGQGNKAQMTEGRYQVVCTYLRDDGFESGAGIASVIDLGQENGGITVSVVSSTNPEVTAINVYVSRPNGKELYLAMTTPNVTGNITYSAHPNFLQHALRMQFRVPPPAFDIISSGRDGRTMYVKDNIVYASEPYSPEHIMDGEAFFPFLHKVTMLAPIEGGIYIGTERATYFASGDTLEKTELDVVAPYGVVMGTSTHIDGALLGDGSVSDILPAWMSHKGFCVGMPGGSVQNLTQTSVDIPKGLRGTTLFRQEDKQNHLVSVIQK